MIDIFTFDKNLKEGRIENCYLFCGVDEFIIKENIEKLVNKIIKSDFVEFNYIRFDGNSLESFEPVINACETVPFMSDKKVVLVYRASFMGEEQSYKSKLSSEFDNIHNYLKNVPKHCVLILYYIFKSKRDKPGKKVYGLDKYMCVVKTDKMKGYQLENKVQELFYERGKNIKKVDLRIFCSLMNENNLNTIENEVEKLCCYTYGRDIEKEDIKKIFLKSNEEDIFDLVNAISNKKVKDALYMLNELIYSGAKVSYILSMIGRQFNLLFKIKLCLKCGNTKAEIMQKLKIKSEYGYSVMLSQSKKFTLNQLKRSIELCLNTERKLKSLSVDEKVEMELLIINTTA
ncbi:DNA polymerase III subunit delta [Clostridium sp. WILCCON 0269]|uniref:DNA polymerase III subunit delta n=1 Tax=Candidatus Clostridium eludens TaxID=3381663 RepID=A0ABW8SKR1_9CLOT